MQEAISFKITANVLNTCFKDCINSFGDQEISKTEEKCLDACTTKFANLIKAINEQMK